MRFVLLLLIAAVSYGQTIIQPAYDPRNYNFSVTNGHGVTGDLSTTGTKTVTFTKCPTGVAAAHTRHNLYISGGFGTPEVVSILGGNCVSGGSNGTLSFTIVNSHNDAWAISSATAGIQEALYTAGVLGNVIVRAGLYPITGTINILSTTSPTLVCDSPETTVIYSNLNAPIVAWNADGVDLYNAELRNCTIANSNTSSGAIGVAFQGVHAIRRIRIQNNRFQGGFYGIKVSTTDVSDWQSVTGNFFENFGNTSPPFYALWNGSGGTGGIISNNQFILATGGWAFYIPNGGGDLVFTSNHIEAGGTTPIHLAKGAGSYNERYVIVGNKFDGYVGPAIEMLSVNNSVVTGNRYVGGGYEPVSQDSLSIDNVVDAGMDGLGSVMQLNNTNGGVLINGNPRDNTKSRLNMGILDQDLGTGQGLGIKSSASVGIGIGQEFSSKLYLIWNYNATAGNAYATIGTFGYSNLLEIQSKSLNFRSSNADLRWISPNDGGFQLVTGTRPTCDSGHRGTTFYVAGGAGVADTYEICRKDAANAYAWVTLF